MNFTTDRQPILILALLLIGVVSTASIIPFMSVYIVEGLGREPWSISLYSGVTILLTLVVNRQFGEWIDQGFEISKLMLTCILAFAVANIILVSVPEFWVVVTIVSVCFSVSNAATSTMYSYGRFYAEHSNLDTTRYNSYLRTMTSLGWMLAPAAAFFVAGQFGHQAVFIVALCLVAPWLVLWWFAIPRNFKCRREEPIIPANAEQSKALNKSLWLAAFICLCFSLAHTLCMSALPLFYLQDVGLPTYAPGLSFSVKTFVEIGAILSSPMLIRFAGARNALLFAAMLAVVAFYALSQVNSLSQLVFGAALEGLYYGIFAGVGITYMQSFAAGKMARATSLYMNSLFLGGLISGSTMGVIAQFYDFRTAIQLASIWAIAAIIALLSVGSKRAL